MVRSSRRLALLIGSPVGTLLGVGADVRRIRMRLEARDFECRECVGVTEATRQGILDALAELKGEARAGDALVVYYTGHGGRCYLPRHAGRSLAREIAYNYLVPTDHELHRDFRGVTDFELSLLFYDLCRKTRNITVILDCCHASTMIRGEQRDDLLRDGPGPRPQERVKRWAGLESVLMPPEHQRFHDQYLDRRHALPLDSNPHVVRVTATAAGSSAYEYSDGEDHGSYLTAELCAALDDAGSAPVSWDTIARRLQVRIAKRRTSTTQRPEVEGPHRRLLFSLEEEADIADCSTLVYHRDGTPWIHAGRLHGVDQGDGLAILDQEGGVVARAEVIAAHDDCARIAVRTADEDAPTDGSRVSLDAYTRRVATWVDPSSPLASRIGEEIAMQPRLRLVGEGADARLRVRPDPQGLRVEGPPWLHRVPRPATDAGIEQVAWDLDDVARRMIFDERIACPEPLGPSIDWEAAVMVLPPGDQELRPLVEGERLPEHTKFKIELRHRDRGRSTLYVNVFDCGVAGRLSLLNPSQPRGVQLCAPQGPGVTMVPVPGGGQRYRLNWPALVPRDASLTERLVFVASPRPIDLRNLQAIPVDVRRRHKARAVTRGDGSSLEDVHPDRDLEALRWEVRCLSFELEP